MNNVLNIIKNTYKNDIKPYILYDISVIFFGVAGGMLLKYIVETILKYKYIVETILK